MRKKSPKYRNRVHIYTDGGCRPNPGRGAAASILVENGIISFKRTQYKANTTNNEMELVAMIQGLVNLKVFSDDTNQIFRVQALSDSQYVIRGINEWMPRWIENGWVGNKGKEIPNLSLWQFLNQLIIDIKETGTRLQFQYVKAHNGNAYNEMVDNMCTQVILANR